MIKCAIVGATGLVGSTFLKVLEEKRLPIDEYVLFASSKSKGRSVRFLDHNYEVEELTETSFDDNRFNYALFSAGSDISIKYAKIAKENGCIVIDNSSAYRMHDDVPLVVPEVNADKINQHNGIIANPNCSTIQSVIPLKILNDLYKIKRIIFSTYQAVSGAGVEGINDLANTLCGKKANKFPYPIANNCIPQIDTFLENGYTKEEMKMIEETRKILDLQNLDITATAVRVPVKNCHCESINVEFEEEFDILDLKQQLNKQEGIVVHDMPEKQIYPIPTFVDGKDEVFVGRIRRDYSVNSGINFWCVADNIRKGAATNAVQILEYLINLK
ncbi:MAG: aspartate-semialdehyde dehydrogenase [Clostridia bacterium]|nr:aspartate-semialdehyde dehydrogenase [Clostridia bacterium]